MFVRDSTQGNTTVYYFNVNKSMNAVQHKEFPEINKKNIMCCIIYIIRGIMAHVEFNAFKIVLKQSLKKNQ